jgi:hypothetical protein
MLNLLKQKKKIFLSRLRIIKIYTENKYLNSKAKNFLNSFYNYTKFRTNSNNVLIFGLGDWTTELVTSSLKSFYKKKIYFYFINKNSNTENTFKNLLKKITNNKIKSVILTEWQNDILPLPYLEYLKKRGIKFFYNAHDSLGKYYLRNRFVNIKNIKKSFTKIILIDNPKKIGFSNNKIFDYKPILIHSKLKINYRPIIKRKYDVAFIGQTVDYRDTRLKYLKKIQEIKNINKKIINREKQFQTINRNEYFNILGNAKIGLNFSETVEGLHQIKLRVFETLSAGCLLFEQKNDQIKTHFKPEIHYVEFNYDNLQDKIIYYLKNKEKMNEIAKNGQKKYLQLNKDCKSTWSFLRIN